MRTTFSTAPSLPSFANLIRVACNRNINHKTTSVKNKKELSNLLDIPLIMNPNFKNTVVLKNGGHLEF